MLRVAIIVPIFNDWVCFKNLVEDLELAIKGLECSVEILAVDDCSTECPPAYIPVSSQISQILRLILVSNFGHQRAIAIGLSLLSHRADIDAVAVMDSDGEDSPLALAQLLRAMTEHPETIIVAQRTRRSEGIAFRFYYRLYKILVWLLTGHSISFGNFCVMPFSYAQMLLNKPEIWNHFAAAIVRSRLPFKELPTARAARYAGQSKMNFINLVAHGLGAISVFSDFVFIRVAIASGCILLLCFLGAMGIVAIRLFTSLAIPGWATNALGFLLLAAIQAVVLPLSMVFMLLNGRASYQLAPRDFAGRFISRIEPISRPAHR